MFSSSSADSTAEPSSKDNGGSPRRGLSSVGIASVVAAGASYLILFIGARTLTPAENAQFLTFWALLFFVLGVVAGIINEFTRAVRAAETYGERAGSGVVVLPFGLLIGAGVAAVIVGSSPLWAASIFPDDTVLLVVVVAVVTIAYAGHCSLAGAAGGTRQWSLFAGLAASEALVRLLLVMIVVVTISNRVGLEVATAAGALTWLTILLFSRSARAASTARADVGPSELLRNVSHAMLSAAATAALVTGFPILLRLTSPLEEYSAAAPLILAVSLTRAPIMIPLQAFQSMLIARFVGVRGSAIFRAMALPIVVLLAVGAFGAAAAAWLGPWIMLVFGSAYVVAPLTMAALTFAGCLMGVLTLTGTACLAHGGHAAYSLGWLVATVVTVALLLLPGSLEARLILSLLIGPLAGSTLHVAALLARTRRGDSESTMTGSEQ